jgi:hypothetical protein
MGLGPPIFVQARESVRSPLIGNKCALKADLSFAAQSSLQGSVQSFSPLVVSRVFRHI